jgi:hypothetical protein
MLFTPKNHMKPINKICEQNAEISHCQNRWCVQLPIGFKGLNTEKYSILEVYFVWKRNLLSNCEHYIPRAKLGFKQAVNTGILWRTTVSSEGVVLLGCDDAV